MLGQETIAVKLDWQDITTVQTAKNINVSYIYFDGSSMNYKYGSLPVFNYEIDKFDNVYEVEIEIINPIYDTLSIETSLSISDYDLAPLDIETWVKYSDKAIINILPLKRNTITNQVILLTEFDIIYKLSPLEEGRNIVSRTTNYSNQSVLSEGNWFKLGIVETGVYKLDWNYINDMGVSPSSINTDEIGVFGNYSGHLPEGNGQSRIDDLQENSIELVGMEDGSFDQEDYILFYAQGQGVWQYNRFSERFDHLNNIYADTVFYFFTPNRGSSKLVNTEESLDVTPTEVVDSYVALISHENDYVNLMSSGKEWFGEQLSMEEPDFMFSHDLPHLITDKKIYFRFDIVARAYDNSFYRVYINDQIVVDSTKISKVDPSSEGIFARRSTRTETFYTHDKFLNVNPTYYTSLSTSRAWINYYVLNFESELVFDGGQMSFRQTDGVDSGNTSRFEMINNFLNVDIWDVTDRNNPIRIDYLQSENTSKFTVSTDTLREFIVVEPDSYMIPVNYIILENQDLHSISMVDMIIISPYQFRSQADRLAQIHYEHDGLVSIVLLPEEIYNEFSSGSQDVVAIRDFMRMLFKKNAFSNGPGYLLMFGDASFDYKHRMHENSNFVPTYESAESLRATTSYVTDDFFGLLDDDEGANCDGVLDIGIGRLPVKSIEEATIAVNKIENYLKKDINTHNNWSKSVCFVADDGDNNLHFKQADLQLVPIVDTLHSGFDIKKIYSDSYKKIEVPGGYRYPDVSDKLNDQVEQGALIVNYTGHGGLIGWSEELILDVPMIHSFYNYDKLPLFITATCEFSRFDNPEFTSAGEYMFLNEEGGGIGLLTTTRLAYAHANIIVNMRIYNNLLEREDGSIPRFGDMIRMSKNPSSVNFLNFTLLGDPALKLAFPTKEVETLRINGKYAYFRADTIKALTEVTVEGVINNKDGSLNSEFSGYIYPEVFDKASVYQTLGNPGGSYSAEFELEDKVIFSGKSRVSNGEFSFSFLVPKDIAYNYGLGKISYYAFDTVNYVDAWGGFNNLFIGGLNNDYENDEQGPDISLFINNPFYKNGTPVDGEVNLIADFFDEDGINFTGNSLGRDIIALIDNNSNLSINLNEYYSSNIDTYKNGNLSYNLGFLEDGWHTITVRAWDLVNNSSTQTIEFLVGDDSGIVLKEVYNYPNPFSNKTNFTYNHNGTTSVKEVEIKIFDIRGKYITSLYENDEELGVVSSVVEWDGKDHNGNLIPDGMFLYNIFITDHQGVTVIQQQKMIKLTN